MKVELEEIRKLDDSNEILTTRLRIHAWWEDYRLDWDKDDYRNLDSIMVPADIVWKPDIAILNGVAEMLRLDLHNTPLQINSDGQLYWSPVDIFETKCRVDWEFYPFDTQHCEIRIGTLSSSDNFIEFTSFGCMKVSDDLSTGTLVAGKHR